MSEVIRLVQAAPGVRCVIGDPRERTQRTQRFLNALARALYIHDISMEAEIAKVADCDIKNKCTIRNQYYPPDPDGLFSEVAEEIKPIICRRLSIDSRFLSIP